MVTIQLTDADYVREFAIRYRDSTDLKKMEIGTNLYTIASRMPRETKGSPSELEMHRTDYQAIKAAGFESPGDLLAHYKALREKVDSQSRAQHEAWAK